MAKKQMMWKTKGMNQDMSVSAFNPEFAFENMNLRLSTNEGNTLMSWVCEKGTKELTVYINNPSWSAETFNYISGVTIGTAILNHWIILFTTKNGTDSIYKLKYSSDKSKLEGELLYRGPLKFSTSNPIETLVSYEAETIQKVYWVDGKNQPRVINIQGKYYKGENNWKPSFIFDFIPELQLNETVTVKKKLGANGIFAPGVIQYAFTYYNKYAQESNIFYTTPLYYISHADRGASPEDKVDNAFEITVTGLDGNFEYLRIYSIQRTSLNGTPFCKRIQDIELKNLNKASFTDTGTVGDTIDPMELLYKGGNAIIASTLEQKGDTLFLGNIQTLVNDALAVKDVAGLSAEGNVTRSFTALSVSSKDYIYANQLSSVSGDKTVPCAGFKYRDIYRCGVQFQHKTGKWSDPTYIDDVPINKTPSAADNIISIPTIIGTIPYNICNELIGKGFVRARAVVVFPSVQDRVSVCQGVVCPTLYTENKRIDGGLYAQSSWLFRDGVSSGYVDVDNGYVYPVSDYKKPLAYTDRKTHAMVDDGGGTNPYDPIADGIRKVEIQGDFNKENKFRIDINTATFHSPDIEFDPQMASTDFSSFISKQVGSASFTKTFSDISIQTETPTASNDGAGFVHKAFNQDSMYGIVSGLFYDDYLINDTNGDSDGYIGAYDGAHSSCKWMVYMWNKSGSLNNDVNRPTNQGIATAKLKKKIISNLRYAGATTFEGSVDGGGDIQLFSSDEPTILKLKNKGIYMGNIDTVLIPDNTDGMYFVFNSMDIQEVGVKNKFCESGERWWKTYYDEIIFSNSQNLFSTSVDNNKKIKSKTGALWCRLDGEWNRRWHDFFTKYGDCALKKGLVRMKYKSTPHLVFNSSGIEWKQRSLPVVEIRNDNNINRYGGNTEDVLKGHNWIPCGEPVKLKTSDTNFYYSYGDTYYQRYDCLKTYAYTPEDENQVVEIGSFMLETRVNIDGRYDKNRGQSSNLNMSPRNFNLINPVYSQLNNFFTYKAHDSDFYKNTQFPNEITWSKTKNAGTDVDLWTNITMASVLDLDGDKGKLNKLIRLNDQLIAFQDTGISQVLYDENVQIQSTEGVPIEIANSGKVQGKRYLSNTIGCSNKWAMATTPNGIYFMDSNDKSIYLFNGQLQNISTQFGFNTWCKQHIPDSTVAWEPVGFANEDSGEKVAFRAFYDKQNQDVLWINNKIALAYSEKIGAFTSFYSYGGSPFFCNLNDTGLWLRGTDNTSVWKHQAGEDYCLFFDNEKSYWMTLVGNPEPQTDKIFTNLEFRACVEGEGAPSTEKDSDGNPVKFTPTLPFDSLETWNEYQHGYAELRNMTGHDLFKHHLTNNTDASLKRKFRIWRCDIPRNNCKLDSEHTSMDFYSLDSELGISRYSRKPQDRMRNPWLYLKLKQSAVKTGDRVEVHDIVMTYFG